jgi:hypothetical protein
MSFEVGSRFCPNCEQIGVVLEDSYSVFTAAEGLHVPLNSRFAPVLSAQRPARDRALTRIPDSPPRRAALCAESLESRPLAVR